MNNRTDNSADDAQDRTADEQAETAENDNKHLTLHLLGPHVSAGYSDVSNEKRPGD